MYLNFLNVTLRNFLSVGNVTQSVRLDVNGLTLVLGNNTDVGSTNSANSRNGVGKAQPLDARIKVPGGWSTMGDMSVGALLSAPDGSTQKVIGVFPQGEKDIYRITFADGRSTEACAEHLWKVWVRKGNDWGWHILSTAEIIAKKNVIKHKPSNRTYVPLVEDDSQEDSNLPIEPRFLGILLGDGGFSRGSIVLSTADQEILDYVSRVIPDEYSWKKTAAKGVDYRISLKDRTNSGDFKQKFHKKSCWLNIILEELGLLHKGSHQKFIPSVFKQSSIPQRISLLSGLIDSDGHVGKNGNISFSTTSEAMANDVCEIVRSIGGIAKITSRITSYTYKGLKKEGKRSYKVSIRYKNPRALTRLTRKLDRISPDYQYSDCLRLEIQSIEPVGKKQAQCIMVDHPDQLYITDDYVVTHNTSLLQSISYGLFGEPLTNIKLDNLVNSINQKGMLVTIEFEVNDISYRIERGRKPNIFKFYKGGKQESDSLGENKHTQEEINHLIGMDHNLFCHIVAMNTYTIPFLKMKPADQREVIEQLLGIVTLSERDDKLVEIIKETKRLVRDEEAMIKAVSDSNARIQTAIDRGEGESHSWKVALQASVARIEGWLAELIDIDFDAELARFDEIDAFNEEYAAIIATVKEEQKETVALKRELENMIFKKADLTADLNKVSDSQIDRLKIEAKRCDLEAEKGCEAEVKRLNDEVARCEREAAKTCDADVARIQTQISRRQADAAKKIAASEEKMAELAAIMAEMENSDGHTCATCGQGIGGTDHLEKIMANLASRAEAIEKAMEKDVTDAMALEGEAAELLVEIEKISAEHEKVQENWLIEASKVKLRIVTVEQTHSATQEEWKQKANTIRADIALAERELLDRKSSIQESIEALALQIGEAEELVEERDTMEAAYFQELQSMKDSAPTPITYSTREETWRAREKFNTLLKDLERENTKENPHDAYVLSLKETLQPISYDQLNEYQDDLKHQEFIHKLLTAKDSFIRKKIIDRNLYLLNTKLDKYLSTLGLPHEVKFKPDLTVEITHMGRDFDFEQLSRGEMNRVVLAVSWSFRDIWEELNNQINLLFVDELIDTGMDDAGAEAALEILSRMAHRKKNVFLVSHKESLIGRVNHILMVHKEEKFTRFELDAEI